MTNSTPQINPHNPLHWALVLWWFITTPRKLKRYRASLPAAGQRQLQLATTWAVSSLAFLPLLLLSIIAGLQSSFITSLAAYATMHSDGSMLWISRGWWVIPLILVVCWVGIPLLGTLSADKKDNTGLGAVVTALGVIVAASLSSLVFGGLLFGLIVAPVCGLAIGLAQAVELVRTRAMTIRLSSGLVLGLIAAGALGIAPVSPIVGIISVVIFCMQASAVHFVLQGQYARA